MVLLTLDKAIGIANRGANIIEGDAIFPLYLVEVHSSRQAPENNRNRQPRTADYRLPVADFWVNYDTVISVHVDLIILHGD